MSRLILIVLTLVVIHFAISNLSVKSDVVVGIASLSLLIALYVFYWTLKPGIIKFINLLKENKNDD